MVPEYAIRLPKADPLPTVELRLFNAARNYPPRL
jgi:hypothetical protein